jgi:hypothetical protein
MIRNSESLALSTLSLVVLAAGLSYAQTSVATTAPHPVQFAATDERPDQGAPALTSKAVKTNSPYGMANYLPLWTSANTIQNSNVFQSTTGNIGVGTTTPAAALDVNGSGMFSGTVAATAYQLGNNLFAYGSFNLGNALLGFAGNSGITGANNTATGSGALLNNGAGVSNTATGYDALGSNITGGGNTADGWGTLTLNTAGFGNTAVGASSMAYITGSYNTGVGFYAGTPTTVIETATGSANTFLGYVTNYGPQTNLSNATAVGAYAEVDASNSMVLGSIANVNGCGTAEFPQCASTNVGIGTTAPTTTLQVAGGDISTTTAGKGLIAKSPDGTKCARIGIDNTGAIVATSITCP